MSKPTTAASSEEVRPDSINPLSDDYINRLIREHGYDSTEVVIARLWQWIGLNGGENSVTLLMYEAHKALSKLRAPVSDIRKGFELTYAADADDPACASDLSHFTNGWRACIMSQVRAPVADERQGDIAAGLQDSAYCAGLQRGFMLGNHNDNDGLRQALESRDGYVKTIKDARAALASAPVTDELSLEAREHGHRRYELGFAAGWDQCVAIAPVAGEAQQPVAKVHRFTFTGMAHAGFFQEALLLDGAPPMPNGTLLYAAHQASASVRIGRATTKSGRVQSYAFEQTGLPDGEHALTVGAPQASEAVRDADPVIGHITVKGKGRSSVDLDASHADLPEGEYVIRAALSAQPGAQRTGGSE